MGWVITLGGVDSMQADKAANRPKAALAGRLFFATDTGFLYYDTGSAWTAVAANAVSGTAANRPAAGVAGRLYFATDTKELTFDTGTAWVDITPVVLNGTAASQPAAAIAGRAYYATDTGVLSIDTGSAWADPNPIVASGTLASRPAAAVAGRLYFATDTLQLFQDTGAAWTQVASAGPAQSATAVAVASSGTIATASLSVSRVNPAAAVTGIVLKAGTYAGQEVWVVNEATTIGYTVTFAAQATSNVASGASIAIAINSASKFVWDAGTSLWFKAS